uniref:Uncharacterized protein n=1 Tax=Globisporangium ultimum (strain ATCC 200006 / CBS 805.95 / DAOM BR144) TaxID=431595 RepID=K3XBV8_GLOUD
MGDRSYRNMIDGRSSVSKYSLLCAVYFCSCALCGISEISRGVKCSPNHNSFTVCVAFTSEWSIEYAGFDKCTWKLPGTRFTYKWPKRRQPSGPVARAIATPLACASCLSCSCSFFLRSSTASVSPANNCLNLSTNASTRLRDARPHGLESLTPDAPRRVVIHGHVVVLLQERLERVLVKHRDDGVRLWQLAVLGVVGVHRLQLLFVRETDVAALVVDADLMFLVMLCLRVPVMSETSTLANSQGRSGTVMLKLMRIV